MRKVVDEFRLLVYPVVLGSGKRLFDERSNTVLKLVEAKPVGAGVIAFVYQVDRGEK
jgi:dihydrofolate reductase